MPRFSAIARAFALATVVTVALVGCTQSPSAAPTSSCGGAVKKVLLADSSATDVASFSAADVPKTFAIPATPVPSCYYVTTTNPAPINGISYTVTHRTLLYIGVSDAQTAALVKAVRATVGVAPWTIQYDDGVPVAPTPAPTPAPAPSGSPAATAVPVAPPGPVSYAGLWDYNFNGSVTDDKGEMGYYVAAPLTAGTAQHAGLPAAVNIVRIEIELRHPQK